MKMNQIINRTSNAFLLLFAILFLSSCEVDKDIKDGIPAVRIAFAGIFKYQHFNFFEIEAAERENINVDFKS